MRRLLLLSACLAAWACRVPDVDREHFACTADADCGEGWVCARGVCVGDSTAEAKRRDAGTAVACETPCAADRRLCCNAACIDPATSREHCGECGHACARLESCVAGTCVRETGRDACVNERDDDGDGLVDCADFDDCEKGTACRHGTCCKGECRREADAALCSNGVDDDCDGRADCTDTDCAGVACAPGKVCEGGGCFEGCLIDGEFRARDAVHATRPCLRCDPVRSSRDWIPVARLATSGTCTGSLACDGEGLCRRRPGEPCAAGSDCATQRCSEGRCAP